MRRGWTPSLAASSSSSAKVTAPSSIPIDTHTSTDADSHQQKRARTSTSFDNLDVIIVKVHSIGKGGLELSGSSLGGSEMEAGEELRLLIDPAAEPDVEPWMEIKGARKLLLPNVKLRVQGRCNMKVQQGETWRMIQVRQIRITGALPTSPYLARLFTFSIPNLRALFDMYPAQQAADHQGINVDLFLALATSVEPSTYQECEGLLQLCCAEKEAGRSTKLFKNKELLDVVDRMLKHQGWKRKVRDPPNTKQATWQALERMEARFCTDMDASTRAEVAKIDHDDDVIGKEMAAESTANLNTNSNSSEQSRLIFGGVDVDPSLNLPDTKDARRQRYMDERKRPQIVYFLQLIQKVLNIPCDDLGSCPSRTLHLVDVGGGRGDLALAVVAFFNHETNHKVHVTVLDVNESSLKAGKERAEAAKLSRYLSFVLCDLADSAQVQQFRSKTTQYDLVFGLHCCGGVAEAAVELALTCHASFCVSTCCFCSNHHLASLTRHAISEAVNHEITEDNKKKRDEAIRKWQKYLSLVTALAVKPGADGQHRAIRVINAMRQAAAASRFQSGNCAARFRIEQWQERFSVTYSVQNRLLVGRVENPR